MQIRVLLLVSMLGVLSAPAFAARTASGVVLPDCDASHPACTEWRQAVQTMNADATNLGAASGERPAKPMLSGPTYMKSLDACIRYEVAVNELTQAAARAARS